METVKVQVPKTPAGAPATIQPQENAARRTKVQRLDEATARSMNGDLVGYYKASWVNNRWNIGRRLPNQDW